MIQVSPRTWQIFAHPHLEELIDNIHQVMITIGQALGPDYDTHHQYLDKEETINEEEPINDEEDEPEDNDDTLEMSDMHGGIRLQLYDSDLKNEDELEGIDGSTIIIDVHARQELMDNENL